MIDITETDQYWEYKRDLVIDEIGLGAIPMEYRTKELCEIAIIEKRDLNGSELKFVPEHLKTKELCEAAVSTSGWALEFVPYELQTQELCELAVKDCLKWIVKYELENLFEKSIPSEFHKELAEKYDIELPDKAKGR